jgi:hypothetical protein
MERFIWKNDKHQCPAAHRDPRGGEDCCLKQEGHSGPHRDIFGVEWFEYDKGKSKFFFFEE